MELTIFEKYYQIHSNISIVLSSMCSAGGNNDSLYENIHYNITFIEYILCVWHIKQGINLQCQRCSVNWFTAGSHCSFWMSMVNFLKEHRNLDCLTIQWETCILMLCKGEWPFGFLLRLFPRTTGNTISKNKVFWLIEMCFLFNTLY